MGFLNDLAIRLSKRDDSPCQQETAQTDRPAGPPRLCFFLDPDSGALSRRVMPGKVDLIQDEAAHMAARGYVRCCSIPHLSLAPGYLGLCRRQAGGRSFWALVRHRGVIPDPCRLPDVGEMVLVRCEDAGEAEREISALLGSPTADGFSLAVDNDADATLHEALAASFLPSKNHAWLAVADPAHWRRLQDEAWNRFETGRLNGEGLEKVLAEIDYSFVTRAVAPFGGDPMAEPAEPDLTTRLRTGQQPSRSFP